MPEKLLSFKSDNCFIKFPLFLVYFNLQISAKKSLFLTNLQLENYSDSDLGFEVSILACFYFMGVEQFFEVDRVAKKKKDPVEIFQFASLRLTQENKVLPSAIFHRKDIGCNVWFQLKNFFSIVRILIPIF